ncbi:MAG TPA: M36 family metallopeptidase [Bryobacteraceae bacterium]|nr:M36 family metallopeptidase [Bryobacteraceae bacterium]
MHQRFATSAIVILSALAARAQGPLKPAVPEPARVDTHKAISAKLARTATGQGLTLKWRRNGSVQSAAGFRSRAYAGTKLQAAQSFLAEHSELVGRAEVLPFNERRLGQRTFIRFQQRLHGIPLRGAHLVVSLGSDNSVGGVSAHLEPAAQVRGEWRLTAQDAITRAVREHGAAASDTPTAEKEYVLVEQNAVPAWRVRFDSADPAGTWEYVVAADDGLILERQNLRRGVSAQGYAYPRNPVRGERERVMLDNLGTDGSLTSAQTKVFSYLPALKGQVEPGTVVQGAAMRGGNFLYEADDARAAEVQLYWGMETASARFRALGFEGFSQPLQGVVLYQDWDPEKKRFIGADNAFFKPGAFGEGRGGIFFYLTSRQGDTSLDTDVIFHEYTHAVVNELVGPRQSAGFRALNEGTADYFSSSFLDDPVMAEYVAKIFGLRSPFLRRTDNEQAWPYSAVGEEHADGNIWSGALWDVRRVLGAAATDEIAINTVAFLSPDAEFYDAAEMAVLTAEELYGERTAELVAKVMGQRGLLTQAAETAANSRWLESGASAEGTIAAARPGYLLLGEQQYRIEVPHRATKLNVRVRANSDARFYIRYRVPVTIEQGKLQAEQMSDTGTSLGGYLSVENTPELQAGTYYVAVVNASTSPLEYSVRVEVDDYNPAARPALIAVRDGETVQGSLPSGPFLGSRQFAVEVPEGTSALSLTLEGDEDVDLYVRQGRFVTVNGTGFPEADLVANSPDTREYLRITGENGGPIPPGVYVVGTYNYSQATTRFRLTARFER